MKKISFYTGNDIVDLLDFDGKINNFHKRFINRILTEKEKTTFFAQENPSAIWFYWAAKEAAFKLICQKLGKRPFVYKSLELKEDFSIIRYENHDIHIALAGGPNLVYATAFESTPIKRFYYSCIEQITPLYQKKAHAFKKHIQKFMPVPHLNSSFYVRVLAIHLLKQIFDSPLEEFSIQCEKYDRIPWAFKEKKKLPVRLSFSHHGKFIAVHFCVKKELDFLPKPFSKENPCYPQPFFRKALPKNIRLQYII